MLLASWQIEEYFVIEQNFQISDSRESRLENKIFVEKRRVSLWEYWLFVIAFEGQVDARVKESLQELCAEENCLFAQIETLDYSLQPPSLEKGEDKVNSARSGRESTLGCSGESCIWKYYKKFIPPYTAVIDLSQSEEDILASMKPKGRYNIRLAEKKWVEVREVKKSPENIKIFHTLMQETTSRDNFAWNTYRYYEIFLEQATSFLLFAYHENEVIAAGIFIQNRESMYYYYGASSSQKRNLMAPYLLQWSAILKAKNIWCRLYDFLGIAAPDEKNSPLAWVSDFKLKLTSDTRSVSQSFLYIHKKWKYRAIFFLRSMKKSSF